MDLLPRQPPLEESAIEQEPDGSPIDAVLARLRERGLLVDRPTASLPKEVRSPRVLHRPDEAAARDADPERAAPGDEWDVPSYNSTLVVVRCPQCRIDQHWPGDVTRLRCPACDSSWRWAICERCRELGLTLERQEIWRCSGCDHYTRSWWRTSAAAREALGVVARRRNLLEATEQQRASSIRRRRVRLVVVAVAIAILLGGGTFLAVTGDTSGPSTGTAETCRQFDRLRSNLGSGTLDATELEASLESLRAASAGADPAVASATVALVAVGRPSEAAFLVAQTKLSDACLATTR